MAKNPSFEQLVDLHEERLSEAETARIRALLDESGQADLAWLARFNRWLEQVQLDAPPQSVRDSLKAQFARKFAVRPQPTLWQRVTAALSVDSWGLQGLPAGARSAEFNAQARQLAYSTDSLDIILDINEGTIYGQLLPKSDSISDDFTVQLVQQDENAGLTNSDDLGEFVLTAGAGEYQIVISNEHAELWLPTFSVA